MVDMALLDYSVREELNKTAPRVMAVLNPLKVVLTNYPDGKVEELEAENNPEDPESGTRLLPFSNTLYVEREDFREDSPRKVVPPGTGQGSPIEARLLHHLPGGREG